MQNLFQHLDNLSGPEVGYLLLCLLQSARAIKITRLATDLPHGDRFVLGVLAIGLFLTLFFILPLFDFLVYIRGSFQAFSNFLKP